MGSDTIWKTPLGLATSRHTSSPSQAAAALMLAACYLFFTTTQLARLTTDFHVCVAHFHSTPADDGTTNDSSKLNMHVDSFSARSRREWSGAPLTQVTKVLAAASSTSALFYGLRRETSDGTCCVRATSTLVLAAWASEFAMRVYRCESCGYGESETRFRSSFLQVSLTAP